MRITSNTGFFKTPLRNRHGPFACTCTHTVLELEPPILPIPIPIPITHPHNPPIPASSPTESRLMARLNSQQITELTGGLAPSIQRNSLHHVRENVPTAIFLPSHLIDGCGGLTAVGGTEYIHKQRHRHKIFEHMVQSLMLRIILVEIKEFRLLPKNGKLFFFSRSFILARPKARNIQF